MRVGLVADVHVGNHRIHGGDTVAGVNRRAREVGNTLARAVALAHEEKCQRLVVAGDLFDASKPAPQIVRLVQEALTEAMPTYVVAGNHDIESYDEGDNALGPLKALKHVHVVERPQVFELDRTALLLVPFQPGDARQWIPRSLAELMRSPGLINDAKLLVTHAGIIDSTTPAFLQRAHDAVELDALQKWMEDFRIDHVAAGNWHSSRGWPPDGETRVVQIGTLAPTGWDNPGLHGYGSLWIYEEGDGRQPRLHIIPPQPARFVRAEVPGPRFVGALTTVDLARAAEEHQKGCSVYVRMAVGPEVGSPSVGDAQHELDRLVLEGKLTAGDAYDPTSDGGAMAREAARAAASGAQSAADGVDAALVAFVAAMPLPDEVHADDEREWREGVVAHAKRFLAAG